MNSKPTIVEFSEWEEFEYYLSLLGGKQEKTELEHERAHRRVAEELGYRVTYFVEIANIPGEFKKWRAGTKYHPEVSNPDHIRQILSAPRKLSESDEKQMEDLL